MGRRHALLALRIATVVAAAAVSMAATAVAQDRPSAKAGKGGQCVDRTGKAIGITRDFAEYEALLIIRQMSGNWPVQTDHISQPAYSCKADGLMWTCTARAKVCKS